MHSSYIGEISTSCFCSLVVIPQIMSHPPQLRIIEDSLRIAYFHISNTWILFPKHRIDQLSFPPNKHSVNLHPMYLHFFLVSFLKCLAIKMCMVNPDFLTNVASFTIRYF